MSTDAEAEAQDAEQVEAARPTAAVPVAGADAGTDPADAEFTVELAPKNGEGVTVQLCRAGRPIAREEQALSFLSNGVKRTRVAARLGRDSPTPDIDVDELIAGVKTALAQLDLQIDEADEDETADALRSPREQRLRDRTRGVEVLRGGEETTYHVTMDPPAHGHDDAPQTLRFTNAQLANQSTQRFTSEHLRAFSAEVRQTADEPALTSEEWDGLRLYWHEIADVSAPGADETTETAIEEFTAHVHHPLKVYDDERAFDRRAPATTKGRALYVTDYKNRGHDALVVPSLAVSAFLDDADTTLSIGELAAALQREGVMLGPSEKYHINGAQTTVWIIDPAAVEWSPEGNIETLAAEERDGGGDANADADPTDAQDSEQEQNAEQDALANGGGAISETTLDDDPRLGGDRS